MAACARTPACSKSLLVKSPAVLAVETMHLCMSSGNRAHHMARGFPSAKSTPPMPCLAASMEPITDR